MKKLIILIFSLLPTLVWANPSNVVSKLIDSTRIIYSFSSNPMCSGPELKEGDGRYMCGVGTAYHITSKLLVTNKHVVQRALAGNIFLDLCQTDRCAYVLEDYKGGRTMATIVGVSLYNDVAVISNTGESVSFMQFDPAVPSVLEKLYNIGNPKGKKFILRIGNLLTVKKELYNGSYYYITSIIARGGQSGSAVINSKGLVIGMITLTHPSQAISYLIPSATIMADVKRILENVGE